MRFRGSLMGSHHAGNSPTGWSEHRHRHGHAHHGHGIVDPGIAATERGLWAVKWSFVGLLATALLQVAVVALSGSVALLADTIHNFADATTAIPLAIALALARVKRSCRVPYGYGRVGDLAAASIVVTIVVTALIAGYQSLLRLFRPEPIAYLWAVAAAALIGFGGNEAVAWLRI